jgi:allophanate hydrolase subunit 2
MHSVPSDRVANTTKDTIDHDGPAHSTHMIAVQRTRVLSVPTYSDGSMIALRRRGYLNVSALFDVHPFIRSAVYERKAAVGSMVGDT